MLKDMMSEANHQLKQVSQSLTCELYLRKDDAYATQHGTMGNPVLQYTMMRKWSVTLSIWPLDDSTLLTYLVGLDIATQELKVAFTHFW